MQLVLMAREHHLVGRHVSLVAIHSISLIYTTSTSTAIVKYVVKLPVHCKWAKNERALTAKREYRVQLASTLSLFYAHAQ